MFNYYTTYYNYIVGVRVQGTIGNVFTYRLNHNVQERIKYKNPGNPKKPKQLIQQDLMRKATWSWHSLPEETKNFYRNNEPYRPIMSGFNFYVRTYINTYK